jgi:hypothetical protein
MATNYSLSAAAGGGVRNGQFPIDTTATAAVGLGDIYFDVFQATGAQSGGVVNIVLNVKSTASCTLYVTNSPMANVVAGTALWYAPGSAVTGQAAGVGTAYSITAPITAVTVAIGTALAGVQANIAIHAGYAPQPPRA